MDKWEIAQAVKSHGEKLLTNGLKCIEPFEVREIVERQQEEINRLQSEKDDLFYKLAGVMHSVDKWLDGDELKQDEVNRAATMREKTLQMVKTLQAENESLKRNGR